MTVTLQTVLLSINGTPRGTRMTLPVPGMQDIPPTGDYDPRSPAVIAPVAAYLASADCPLTGQALSVRGGSVIINKGWSRGPRVNKDDALWTVEELAERIAELPCDDPFDMLAETLGGAVGTACRRTPSCAERCTEKRAE